MTRAGGARQRGLSLIEVLIGIAVGMITIVVVFQTLSIWDKHANTTNSGSDMQLAGTLGMFGLERDLKLAGYGFAQAAPTTMGCAVDVKSGAFHFPLAPVQISSAPDGTGIIDVLWGDSSYYVTHEQFTGATTNTAKITRRGGFKAGDLVVLTGNDGAGVGSADCALVELTDASDGDGVSVAYATGAYTNFYSGAASATFNTAAGTGTTFTNGYVFNLGPSPQLNRWAIDNGSLERTDLIHGTAAFPVAEGVVDLQAQYGVDTNGDGQISDTEWTSAAPTDWTQVLAVRVGVLVRGRQFEKAGDTPYAASGAMAGASSAASWFGNSFVMRNLDGSTTDMGPNTVDPNNWRYYRYRVYQQVIPLRNVLWK